VGTGVRRIAIVGRRPAIHMKFSEQELSEFGDLLRARPALGKSDALDGLSGKPADMLRSVCERSYDGDRIDIAFHFGLTPVAFEGVARLQRVRFVDADGLETILPAQLAVTCIGYETHGHGLPIEAGSLRNEDGRIGPGLYVAGWARRGPSGTIPTNRAEAQVLAKKILSERGSGEKPGTSALGELLRLRAASHVDYGAWRRIDASEVTRADASRTRRKWRSLDELLAAAQAPPV
jgi:ferredoxin--NADP+ reductase